MAYPVISAPYGLIPVNLIGGQVNTGSTREYPIQFAYGTNIFFGDFVQLSRGFINRAAISTGTGLNQTVGVFLGCSYTNPLTKQKFFSQYWPSGTLSGDAVAVVSDDPDLVFKAVMCSATTVVGSAAFAMIGQNVSAIDNSSGSQITGDSKNAVLVPTATPVTTTIPLRIIDVVKDTAVSLGSATWSSGTSTLTVSALPNALPVGTDVAVLGTNGLLARSGSFVTSAASAGATSVSLNQAPTYTIGSGNIGSTVVFTQYPEVLVKLQFGAHQYYSATGNA